MPADFPSNPSTGNTYSYGGSLYTFDGNGWKISSTATVEFPSQTGNVNEYLITDGNNLSWATISTANVSEGTNLYFTNARVYSNVVSLNYATVSYVDTKTADAGFNPFLLAGM